VQDLNTRLSNGAAHLEMLAEQHAMKAIAGEGALARELRRHINPAQTIVDAITQRFQDAQERDARLALEFDFMSQRWRAGRCIVTKAARNDLDFMGRYQPLLVAAQGEARGEYVDGAPLTEGRGLDGLMEAVRGMWSVE
jgi:hypothetical protein